MVAPFNILKTGMVCVFCNGVVEPWPFGNGYQCADSDCNAQYFANGMAIAEDAPPNQDECEEPVRVMQDMAHGWFWYWCRDHGEYEPTTCRRRLAYSRSRD